jgi:pyrrolidone-carboxylate peptidase
MMFDVKFHDLCAPLILAPVSLFSRLREAEIPAKMVRTAAFVCSFLLNSANVDRTAPHLANIGTIRI